MKFNIPERSKRVRPDGLSKVTGELKYLTDLELPDMLYGKILRSAYPHAKILSINTEKAECLPGVEAVVTHKDVPGMNRFGIMIPDQPVLCEDRVRYIGDAIAAVAAKSVVIANEALQLIEVEYEELPILDDMQKALHPDAPRLHPKGNIAHCSSYQAGNIYKGFAECAVVVKETYELPMQLHGYLETEGGVIVPEENGGITVYAGTQHGFKDRFQLSRILAIPESDIRIISSPMGGSFGGKDELNIQPYAALLALKAGKPVKIHNTRKESIRASIKNHPMKIKMKTGVDSSGKLMAHQVEIMADTGAYSTLGPAVLDFAVELVSGPYIIPNVDIEGQAIFTNNGVSGEFRGFGGGHVTFALEVHMNRLAAALGIDVVEFRRRNIRKPTDIGPLGQRIAPTNSASDVLEAVNDLLLNKEKSEPSSHLKRRGRGMAITMHGGGLGFGLLDSAGGSMMINQEGKIEIAFGFEECGQGLLAVIENIVVEEIGCSPADIQIVIGDTDRVPSTGSSTASRSTSMVWHAVKRMKNSFCGKVCKVASSILNVPEEKLFLGESGVWQEGVDFPVLTYQECIQGMEETDCIKVHTKFHFPTTPDAVLGSHFLYVFAGVTVDVDVDLLTGKVKVIDVNHVVAAGPVVSPIGYRGQIEGGGIMSLGYALMENVKWLMVNI